MQLRIVVSVLPFRVTEFVPCKLSEHAVVDEALAHVGHPSTMPVAVSVAVIGDDTVIFWRTPY